MSVILDPDGQNCLYLCYANETGSADPGLSSRRESGATDMNMLLKLVDVIMQ